MGGGGGLPSSRELQSSLSVEIRRRPGQLRRQPAGRGGVIKGRGGERGEGGGREGRGREVGEGTEGEREGEGWE